MVLDSAGAHGRQRGRRVFARRERYFVLAGGFVLQQPRCSCCGREFDAPRRYGQKFRTALPILEPRIFSPRLASGARLFIGSTVLVAAVNRRLDDLLDSSVTFIGERVLVALAKLPQGIRVPYVLCRGCGGKVLSKATHVSGPYYKWDWLADLRPRWLARWRKSGGRA